MASVCDALDGFFSRILKNESELGAELDSLSDFLSFAVAPCILIYMSLINKNEVIGLISLLLFVIFSCIRLAKFNTEKFNKRSNLRYFNGVPTPAGCGLLILPLIHSFIGIEWASNNQFFLNIYIFIVGLLLVSNIPTFSFKQLKIKVRKKNYIYFSVIFFLVLLSLINFLWVSISTIGLLYLFSLPISLRAYKFQLNKITKNI
jgi:CDP-diacylglycerol--serine O-phosphatidyltransferase